MKVLFERIILKSHIFLVPYLQRIVKNGEWDVRYEMGKNPELTHY